MQEIDLDLAEEKWLAGEKKKKDCKQQEQHGQSRLTMFRGR